MRTNHLTERKITTKIPLFVYRIMIEYCDANQISESDLIYAAVTDVLKAWKDEQNGILPYVPPAIALAGER